MTEDRKYKLKKAKILRCPNPHCNELFVQRSRNQVYCCDACNRAVQIQTMQAKYKHHSKRKSFITLPNGIEIRNDAMGKEISQPLVVWNG